MPEIVLPETDCSFPDGPEYIEAAVINGFDSAIHPRLPG
jgi:hypothetical protein